MAKNPRIEIEFDPATKGISINAPIGDKMLCLALLEFAKFNIMSAPPPPPAKEIIVPPTPRQNVELSQ
jgi:hypothetical protein